MLPPDPARTGEHDGSRTRHAVAGVSRTALALLGAASIIVAELISAGSVQDALATLGLLSMLAAALLALYAPGSDFAVAHPPRSRRFSWPIAHVGVALVAGGLIQTWFKPGTVVAGGDIAPPLGTAWIGRTFSPFVWSGNDLGSPGVGAVKLAWASVDWVVHALGGSGAVAQRIWLTGLVAAVAFSATALCQALDLSPLAAVAAGLAYVFNPYVLSNVGDNDVYLVAMLLLAGFPALLLATASTRLRARWALVVLVPGAVLLGYAYANPPLVGMVTVASLATPLIAWMRFGSRVARRACVGLAVGGLTLLGASAYWIVPAKTALANVAVHQLSQVSDWSWTEGRSTLANAMWLNTSWGWTDTSYYPYAAAFSHLPLLLLRPLLPTVALIGLAFRVRDGERGACLMRLRGAIAIATLSVILISTGTRSPGNIVFNPIYHLPYGWLLREPGRFLMIGALGFAMLAGLFVEHMVERCRKRSSEKPHCRTARAAPLAACAAVAAVALACFPLWTGSVIPGARNGFPPMHVTVPGYWSAMTRYLNNAAAPGAVLALPPDDFYQMPYTWYYGVDSFAPAMLDRHVLVPSGQGYSPASDELLEAVNLESAALLAGDWSTARRLLEAMDTPFVLLRGDINAPTFQQRRIPSPSSLDAQLAADPFMRLVRMEGNLSLYEVTTPIASAKDFATIDSPAPDLRMLSLLPDHTALISSTPIAGHAELVQVPPVSSWKVNRNSLSTTVAEHPGWTYSVRALEAPGDTNHLVRDGVRVESITAGDGSAELRVSVPIGKSVLHNGDFAAGAWGDVGNCNDAEPVGSSDELQARRLPTAGPDGTPALELSTTIDSACESTPLTWTTGRVLLSMSVRSVSGAPARLCVWEEPIERCAQTDPLPTSAEWQQYRTIVTPDRGTKTLTLFLYADMSPGQRSVEQYAQVTAHSMSVDPQICVVGVPQDPAGEADTTTLMATDTSFSDAWDGPAGAPHVIVDGLRNGWLVPASSAAQSTPRYRPAALIVRKELELAAGSFLAAAIISIGFAVGRRRWAR